MPEIVPKESPKWNKPLSAYQMGFVCRRVMARKGDRDGSNPSGVLAPSHLVLSSQASEPSSGSCVDISLLPNALHFSTTSGLKHVFL